MSDKRKTGEGGMKGWATRRRNGTDSVKKAVAAERERCAHIADTMAHKLSTSREFTAERILWDCAAAIRKGEP